MQRVPPAHWNESVFRFFLVRRLLSAAPTVDCRTEWNRVDLVFPDPDGAALVEVKFFATQPLSDHTGRLIRMKGGPSAQNHQEYEAVLEKLRLSRRADWAPSCGGVAEAYLVLAYEDAIGARYTYASHYDAVEPSGPVRFIQQIVQRAPIGGDAVFTCKLLMIDLAPAI